MARSLLVARQRQPLARRSRFGSFFAVAAFGQGLSASRHQEEYRPLSS